MTHPNIIAIGAAHWDIIGISRVALRPGDDLPGHITRSPGGVALNIAGTLARLGLRPALLSAIGTDAEGDALVGACLARAIITAHIHRAAGPTDRYLAIESPDGLVAALADASTLEKSGAEILAPLGNGSLGSAARPWPGLVVIDGNLTGALLRLIATSPLFSAADLRLAPASPAKAHRLAPLLRHPRATLYLNLAEAAVLGGQTFADTAAAAEALLHLGAHRVLITNGAETTADGSAQGVMVQAPPRLAVRRVTGAGDTFMAAHIAAQYRGLARAEALHCAVQAAADFVAGDACPPD